MRFDPIPSVIVIHVPPVKVVLFLVATEWQGRLRQAHRRHVSEIPLFLEDEGEDEEEGGPRGGAGEYLLGVLGVVGGAGGGRGRMG